VEDDGVSERRSLYLGAPYEYAAVVLPGAPIFTAGACPSTPTGR
jgi:hypothetical protein